MKFSNVSAIVSSQHSITIELNFENVYLANVLPFFVIL